jgi:hypothetical protein
MGTGGSFPGREADYSPPSSAEVKNGGAIPPLHSYVFMAWCLIKHKDNFNFSGKCLKREVVVKNDPVFVSRNDFLGGKWRPARKADSLTAVSEPTV